MAEPPPAADLAGSADRVAAGLGLPDPAPVRSLLAAWWSWAGAVGARGGVMDSAAFLDQREAEGVLELPRPVAERAIELELAYLHGLRASGRVGAAAPAARPAPARRQQAQISPGLVGAIAFGSLAVLVVGGIALGEAIPHVPLPGGGDEADTAPYRAWIGLLAGALGLAAALVGARLRPAAAPALRIPAIGLAALALFSLGLLSGAAWLVWGGGVLFCVAGAAAWLQGRGAGR